VNVVDSSGWLEYLAGGKNAGFFAAALEDSRRLLVPALCMFEVFRRVQQLRSRDAALEAVALMRQGKVIALDERLALVAAEISLQERLPTADSIILATARAHAATLWTQDADFAGKRDVKYTASPR
jgi:toxin FitB